MKNVQQVVVVVVVVVHRVVVVVVVPHSRYSAVVEEIDGWR